MLRSSAPLSEVIPAGSDRANSAAVRSCIICAGRFLSEPMKSFLIFSLTLLGNLEGATLTLLTKTHADPDSFAGNSAGNVDSPKGSATGATFSADGLRVVVGDFKATAHYFEADANFALTRRFRARHENGPFTGVNGEVGPAMFSPEGDFFATGINAKGAKVWSVAAGLADADGILETNQFSQHLTPTQTCDGANWSPDGQWFAAGAYLVLKVYSRPTFTEVASFTHPGTSTWEVNSVDFANDPVTGELLMLSGSGSGTSGTVLLHRLRGGVWSEVYRWSDFTNTPPAGSTRLGGIGGSVKSVRFSPDGKLWGIGCRSSVSRIYRTDTGAQIANLPSTGNTAWLAGDDEDANAAVEAIEWSSCGRYFFHGGLIDGALRVWRRGDWSLAGWVQTQSTLGPLGGRSDEGLRAIEFLDVREDKVLIAGDEGTAQIARFDAPVLDLPYQQSSSPPYLAVMEAEAAHGRVAQGLHGPTTTFTNNSVTRNVRSVIDGIRNWGNVAEPAASGSMAVQALPDNGDQSGTNPQTNDPRVDSPKLDFRIQFTRTGTHYVWVRGFATTTGNNSCHVGLDHGANNIAGTPGLDLNFATLNQWTWSSVNATSVRRTVNITSTGLHTLHLWMREAGLKVDQVLVTTDASYIPANSGLATSPRADLGVLQPRLVAEWSLPTGSGHADFTYQRGTANAGSFFLLEYSADLKTWSLAHGSRPVSIVSAGPGTESVTLRWDIPASLAGTPKMFVRVREEWLGGP